VKQKPPLSLFEIRKLIWTKASWLWVPAVKFQGCMFFLFHNQPARLWPFFWGWLKLTTPHGSNSLHSKMVLLEINYEWITRWDDEIKLQGWMITVDGNQKSCMLKCNFYHYPIISQESISPNRGCLRFLNHQQYQTNIGPRDLTPLKVICSQRISLTAPFQNTQH